MFDFHMHSVVSYDGQSTGQEMALAAAAAGLKEICFTDHLDYDPFAAEQTMNFDTDAYNAAYDHLDIPGLKIRRGAEFGMLPDNAQQLQQDLQRRHLKLRQLPQRLYRERKHQPVLNLFFADSAAQKMKPEPNSAVPAAQSSDRVCWI